jgi:hypothetical protein
MSLPVRWRASSLFRNVAAGMRLALFLPVRGFDFRASPLDYALLVALDFALWVLAAAWRTGFGGEFDPAAVPIYLVSVPLVLATALAVSHAYRAPERLMLIAVALIASDPLFELVGMLLPYIAALSGLGTSLLYLYFAWVWVTAIRAVKIAAGARRPQYYRGALAVSAMIALGFFVLPKTDVWHKPVEEEPVAALADERLFHLQGELIERELAAIQPGRAGVPELYFIGFAPDASQDVFLRELGFVKRLFEERFGAAGRSIALASSTGSLDKLPIASATNLARSLQRVGEAMNPDEDVLFLYLSAHGDREHRLSAWQPPLELAQLTPTALARMLHDSGIKWRVIVVSACYSGGFIEPLRDENTLVIAAAAADRTSFGCEAGRDFTYFGEAYFREAMAKTRSFIHAFATAKEIVTRKEAAEKLTPSLPQMWVGPAIAAQLNKLAE